MATSDSVSDEESLDSLDQLKEHVCGLSKAKLKELLFTLMDEYDALTSENCMQKDVCAVIKKHIKELEHQSKILKSEKVDLDMKHLVLHDDLNKVKETLSLKEEAFPTDFAKLKNESLELKQKVESLLDENNKFLVKLNQVESDLAANNRWNRASHALNWLSDHHNQGRKGLGFQQNTQFTLDIGSMWGYLKILCVFIMAKSDMLGILSHQGTMP